MRRNMSRIQSWRVSGCTTFDLSWDGEKLCIEEESLPKDSKGLLAMVDILDAIKVAVPQIEDGDQLVIDWESEGYYDPGYIGTPDNCQAPEGEDIRTLEQVTIDLIRWEGEKNCKHYVGKLPKDLQEKIFGIFEDKVNAAEIDRYAEC